MTPKLILVLLLCAQIFALRPVHYNATAGNSTVGASALTAADESALITFICIGVVAIIVICILIWWLFKKDPSHYHESAYARGGEDRPNYV